MNGYTVYLCAVTIGGTVFHISIFYLFLRFWKIADTFTGLKLKGLIGHFGKFTATDIEGFVELPDGKVSAALTSGLYADLQGLEMQVQQYVYINIA